MADFSIKQNDTWPALEATLRDKNGVINLTTATEVRLLLKGTRRNAPASVAGVCTIVDAAAGEVSYEWIAADTAVADTYNGEFEIAWGDGSIGTVPNDRYFSLVIKPDLG